jgi:hypothetical protein
MPDWRTYVRQQLPLSGIRPDAEQDVIDDLAAQLDEAYREHVARGLSDADATAAAMAHVTDWPALAREVSESRRLAAPVVDRLTGRALDAALDGDRRAGVLAGVLQDLRVATRLHRHRGYFAFATTTLAVAVGINLIVFTIVNALWLRPLPFPDADRLVAITGGAFVAVSGQIFQPFDAVAGQAVIDESHAGSADLRPQLAFDQVSRELETIGVTAGSGAGPM